MTERNSGVVVCWYFHLATACTDWEVADMARRSITPLLAAHRKAQQAVVLAISGSLLSRIAEIAPSVIDDIDGLLRQGLCEIAATCQHEVYPPAVPFRFLSLHVSRDVQIKRATFGVTPRIFYPPNLVWVGAFEHILAENGIDSVILDGAHYRLGASAQTWKWTLSDINHIATELLEPDVDPREVWRVVEYRARELPLDGSKQRRLRCFFRDNRAVARFSFGNAGLIHCVDDAGASADFVNDLSKQTDAGHLITLADDGDRVNPVSLFRYQGFLHELAAGTCALPADCSPSRAYPELAYLPSFATAGFDEFVRSGLDSTHYLSLLAELYANDRLDARGVDELLALQDVFFLFWKTLPRKHEYLERLLTLQHTNKGRGIEANTPQRAEDYYQ